MSVHQSKTPDLEALLAILRRASELCRRLDLPNDAATFDAFIACFQKQPPTQDILRDDVYCAMNGLPALRILSKVKDRSEYNRLQQAFSDIAFPETRKKYEQIGNRKKQRPIRKAIRDSKIFWQLQGESDLYAIAIPDPPNSGIATTIRLTHANSYGPFDGAEFFVRISDPLRLTQPDDLDSATDWVRAALVEELVTVDAEEMLRSEAKEPFEEETPWEGTYEAQLVIPSGRHAIEIKVVSQHSELLHSQVLTGWEISANWTKTH